MPIDECCAKCIGCATICEKKTWAEQKSCKYSEKSEYRNCCKDYSDIDGGLCQNLDAQRLALKEK